MMREAESHATDDKQKKDEIEARNRADQTVYGAERLIQESGDKLPADVRSAVESAIADTKKAMEGTDQTVLNRSLEALTAAQHKAAEALYQQQPPPGGEQGPTSGQSGSRDAGGAQGDVIDAEVVDEDTKKA
jgi:molecular chaperone DnaK